MRFHHASTRMLLSLLVVFCASLAFGSVAAADFQITPAALTLDGNLARAQLIVTESAANGTINERSADLTHQARYVSSDPRIVSVGNCCLLLAHSNCSATIAVSAAGVAHNVAVIVKGVVALARKSYKRGTVLHRFRCYRGI